MIDTARIRQIIALVPHPPDRAIPNGVSLHDCAQFEQRNGILLPDELIEWLKVSNGPCIGPGGFFGILTPDSYLDIETYLHLFPSWRTKKWIPIAGDGCGNHYVVATEGEFGHGFPVLFIESTANSETPAFIVASDIGHFVVAILEKEAGAPGWPFDRTIVTSSDPSITAFHGVSMPWEID